MMFYLIHFFGSEFISQQRFRSEVTLKAVTSDMRSDQDRIETSNKELHFFFFAAAAAAATDTHTVSAASLTASLYSCCLLTSICYSMLKKDGLTSGWWQCEL